jgi:hypothetical protein
LFSIPIDLVRCGLSLSLVGACCSFDSIPSIPVDYSGLWIKGRGVPCLFRLLLFVLKPLYACTFVDRSISVFLVVTTTLLRTLEMS